MARHHIIRTFDCGCFYEECTEDGELLSLRLTTCSYCMDAALLKLESLDTRTQLTLPLPSPRTAGAEGLQS